MTEERRNELLKLMYEASNAVNFFREVTKWELTDSAWIANSFMHSINGKFVENGIVVGKGIEEFAEAAGAELNEYTCDGFCTQYFEAFDAIFIHTVRNEEGKDE